MIHENVTQSTELNTSTSSEKVVCIKKFAYRWQKGSTAIPNSLLFDKRLTMQARNILIVFLQHPEGWQFYSSKLASDIGIHRETLGIYVRELIAKGYMRREQNRIKGKFSTYSYEFDSEPIFANNPDITEGEYLDFQKGFTERGLPEPVIPALHKVLRVNIETPPTSIKVSDDAVVDSSCSSISQKKQEPPLFKCFEDYPMSDIDKSKASARFSEDLCRKVITHCTTPPFKPTKSYTASFFYFANNPEKMVPSKKQIENEKSKEKDTLGEMIQRHWHYARACEKEYLDKTQSDIAQRRGFYINVGTKDIIIGTVIAQKKALYDNPNFKQNLQDLWKEFNFAISIKHVK